MAPTSSTCGPVASHTIVWATSYSPLMCLALLHFARFKLFRPLLSRLFRRSLPILGSCAYAHESLLQLMIFLATKSMRVFVFYLTLTHHPTSHNACSYDCTFSSISVSVFNLFLFPGFWDSPFNIVGSRRSGYSPTSAYSTSIRFLLSEYD
jgi:hypothetical protein